MKGKEALIGFAESGRYVFHGSPIKLDMLEPRQATRFDVVLKKRVLDGMPCVAATEYYEIAIFRSLINAQISAGLGIKNHKSGFGVRMGVPYFRASELPLEHARSGVVGFVHVLKRDTFEIVNDMESRSYIPVVPVAVVEVTGKDLPEEIEIV